MTAQGRWDTNIGEAEDLGAWATDKAKANGHNGTKGNSGQGKPVIQVTCTDLDLMERQSREALEGYQPSRPDHERLYLQDGGLVWARQVKECDGVYSRIQRVKPASLRVEWASAAYPCTRLSAGWPPSPLIDGLAASRDWPFPPL